MRLKWVILRVYSRKGKSWSGQNLTNWSTSSGPASLLCFSVTAVHLSQGVYVLQSLLVLLCTVWGLIAEQEVRQNFEYIEIWVSMCVMIWNNQPMITLSPPTSHMHSTTWLILTADRNQRLAHLRAQIALAAHRDLLPKGTPWARASWKVSC